MRKQFSKVAATLANPERIVASRSDDDVALYYKFFDETPVGAMYLCVVVKSETESRFMLTAYFTNTVKKGTVLWQKVSK